MITQALSQLRRTATSHQHRLPVNSLPPIQSLLFSSSNPSFLRSFVRSFSDDAPNRNPPSVDDVSDTAVATPKRIKITKKDLATEESLRKLYDRWRSRYNVQRDPEEIKWRFNVFKENVKFVHETNKKKLSYRVGLNPFSDMTEEEFGRKYCGLGRGR